VYFHSDLCVSVWQDELVNHSLFPSPIPTCVKTIIFEIFLEKKSLENWTERDCPFSGVFLQRSRLKCKYSKYYFEFQYFNVKKEFGAEFVKCTVQYSI